MNTPIWNQNAVDGRPHPDPHLGEGERRQDQGRGPAAVLVQVVEPLLRLVLGQRDAHRRRVVAPVRAPGPPLPVLMSLVTNCDDKSHDDEEATSSILPLLRSIT